MIPLENLKPGMLFIYNSSPSLYKPLHIIVTSIESEGPRLTNLQTGYRYGIVTDYHYFHKFNTSKERVFQDLKSSLGILE